MASRVGRATTRADRRRAHLLPNFDEYIVAYADRRSVYDTRRSTYADPRSAPLFSHTVIVGGRVVGTWRRTLRTDAVAINAILSDGLGQADRVAVTAAAERYATFLEKTLQLTYGG